MSVQYAEGYEPVPYELISPTFAPGLPSMCRCRGCWPRIADADLVRPKTHLLLDHVDGGSPPLAVSMLKQRRTYQCSSCGSRGHNVRSCARRLVPA